MRANRQVLVFQQSLQISFWVEYTCGVQSQGRNKHDRSRDSNFQIPQLHFKVAYSTILIKQNYVSINSMTDVACWKGMLMKLTGITEATITYLGNF